MRIMCVECIAQRGFSRRLQVTELVSYGLQEVGVSRTPAHPQCHPSFSLPPLREPPLPALLPCLAGDLSDEQRPPCATAAAGRGVCQQPAAGRGAGGAAREAAGGAGGLPCWLRRSGFQDMRRHAMRLQQELL